MAYDETQHRGENGGSGCSIRYLLVLLLELKKCRIYPFLCVTRTSDDELHSRRLQFIASEISRLLQNPHLFPSPEVKARFFAILGADAELQFSQACKSLLLKREIRNLDRNSRTTLTRTTYKDGSIGWENFLLNGAPGSGFTSNRTIPKSIFQVVPAVGMRIIADYDQEETGIVKFVEESTVPLDVSPATTTFLIDWDKPRPDQHIPDIQMAKQSGLDVIRPNPFQEDRKPRLDLIAPGSEPLEIFSRFIHQLQIPPLPPNVPPQVLNASNAFPIVTLHSWHPQPRLPDLRPLR